MDRNRVSMSALALALCCLAAPVQADSGDSLRELSAQWWQWVYSLPLDDKHPVKDKTGEHCMVGQGGGVWFLAGTFGGTVQRSCSVPEGVALFFPVLNGAWVNTPGCDGEEVMTVAELRALVAPGIDAATVLSVKLDSKPVRKIRRVRSVNFPVVFPPENAGNCSKSGSVSAGTVYSPSVDDGYYVLLRGLKAGPHKLRIRGAHNYGDGFSLDVTYTLTVVPVNK